MHTSIVCINILQNIKAVVPNCRRRQPSKSCTSTFFVYPEGRMDRGKLIIICPPPPNSSKYKLLIFRHYLPPKMQKMTFLLCRMKYDGFLELYIYIQLLLDQHIKLYFYYYSLLKIGVSMYTKSMSSFLVGLKLVTHQMTDYILL